MRDAIFYTTYGGTPVYNMAFDEWLFSRVKKQPGLVIFRLYCWSPGAITFGYNQSIENAFDAHRLSKTEVIRRVTGGRALYHDQTELTYTVAVNVRGVECEQLNGELTQTSRAVANALSAFMGAVGRESTYARQSSSFDSKPLKAQKAPCFASVSRHEIISNGKKVVASAQRRIGDSYLQHGSLKLGRIATHPALDAGKFGTEPGEPVAPELFKHYCRQFVTALEETLDIGLAQGELNQDELNDLSRTREYVEKNRLNRRDIF